jgi:hypothetical protein
MTKKKIAELIERAKRGEELPLHRDDEEVRAHAECLLEEWRQRLPLSEDDRDFLMEVLQAYVFPGRHGRFPKRLEARESEAQALAWGRRYKAELKARGYSVVEAADRTVSELRHRYPREMAGKTPTTIKGLLQRRP